MVLDVQPDMVSLDAALALCWSDTLNMAFPDIDMTKVGTTPFPALDEDANILRASSASTVAFARRRVP